MPVDAKFKLTQINTVANPFTKEVLVTCRASFTGNYVTGGIPMDFSTDSRFPKNLVQTWVDIGAVGDAKITTRYSTATKKVVFVEDDASSGVPAQEANATSFTTPMVAAVRATLRMKAFPRSARR